MKKVAVTILVVTSVIALLVFIYSQMRAVTAKAAAISDDVIARYVGLIEAGKYEEAYDSCISAGRQKETSRADFVAAHNKHVTDYGPLKGWRETDYQHEANLFSSESLIGINGVLSYANRDVFVLYKVDLNVEPYRINEIFGSPGLSTSLANGVW